MDRINKNAGLNPVKVKPELIDVLEKALEYAEKSGRAFDPTVGPLVKLRGIGTDEERVPEDEEIRKALELINYREVEINREESAVFLKRGGMALDLGAIAKGYAADETVKLLAKEGVDSAVIDLGGNIYAMGDKKEGKGGGAYWRVGIQDPRADRGNYIGILNVKNKSVVTSGMYERFFEKDGKRYHHIFSATNGYPVENNLLSVTITADDSIDADALSTAAFALGWEKGRELIAGVKGAGGIFVFDDLGVRVTDNLEDYFTLTAAEYSLILYQQAPAQKPENY
jgi:thiamine biosynthesis lipoprotein